MRQTILAFSMFLAVGTAVAAEPAQRTLTFEDRVKAQRAIEAVYWRHRIWPKENAAPKPAFPDMMPDSAIRARVEVYLRKTHGRSGRATRGITARDLQAELDRMARDSRDRRTLRELFDALGDDPFLIAETLARQTLSERLAAEDSSGDLATSADALSDSTAFPFRMPRLEVSACEPGTWTPTHMDVPDRRLGHYAVWTGSEMVVWGGNTYFAHDLQSGGRYDPLTDTWIPTSTGDGVPVSVYNATVVWTGSEMIVWGGLYFDPAAGETYPNTGSRYSPATDSWQRVSTGPYTPAGRHRHTAVWTGTEMIVWGGHYYDGYFGNVYLNTGGRYDPATDTWQPVSTGPNTPSSRHNHTAVWTGSKMIVWGGEHIGSPLSTGGRYDPSNDTWTPTSTGANTPFVREQHTAVWTGDRMVVWGGTGFSGYPINTGGRYDPDADTWQPTSTGTGVPPGSASHTAIWSGSEMIVWGGDVGAGTSQGAIYDPAANTWRATAISPLNPRTYHTAVWSGTEMIVWGGWDENRDTNSGARYDPASDTWITMSSNAAAATGRQNAAGVWTGAEMIVWGGLDAESLPAPETLNTGGRYFPATDSWTRMSTANAPASRYGHIGVWTGREMIVWGGNPVYNGATWLTSGGRYDPSNDTWTATADDANTPPAAAGRSAVWTGREMIVWGGSGISTGGRYDPASDSWTPTSTGANVPSGGSSTVWSGTQMIVWNGGSTPGGRYDPRTDTWASMASGAGLLGVRIGYSAVWSGDEMIVWGGWRGGYLNTGARYDPSTDTWMAMSNLGAASPRASHQAVWTGASMILWGGNGPSSVPSNGGGVYEPATDSWSEIAAEPPAPTARAIAVSVWTGTSMIVWGGQTGTATGGVYCACPEGRLMYRDTDGDGYGDPAYSAPSCDGSIAQGYIANQLDCDDSNSNVHPGAAEVCNGLDDNCDGLVDNSGTALCDDGNSCTSGDTCGGGVCRGVPVIDGTACNDDNPCTSGDVCSGAICQGTLVVDGTACSDGNACTAGDACTEGACHGTAIDCNDHNPCTDDSCSPTYGCQHANNTGSCNDGSACTVSDTCSGGACHGMAIACDDGDRCTIDSCNLATGCVHTVSTGPCDDGNPCTAGDTCATGICIGTPVSGNACDDGNACTTGDFCVSGDCYPGAGVLDCNDDSVCTDDSCDPYTGCLHDSNQSGDLCDDGNPCTTNACDPVLFCVFPPSPAGGACDDFDPCTNTDRCDGRGNCAGQAVCDDHDPCTDDFANANAACACSHVPSFPGTTCSDNNACTIGEVCDGTGTLNSCDGGTPVDCDDNNPCTDDSCDPATGCVHVNNVNACDDGNACTVDDRCGGGTCDSGTPLVCNDSNPCTDDSCNSATGCVFVNNTRPCSDGNACTTGDSCGDGVCSPGRPADCDDGNCCTVDSCNPTAGCVHTANTTVPMFTTQPTLNNSLLWPPTHGYADFTVDNTGAAAASQCGIASIRFASCSSSQPENATGTGDGNSTRDCVYAPGLLSVRAERDGSCSPIGRVYATTLIAVDVCGSTVTSNPFDVGVWHDRGQAPTAGAIVDDIGGAGDTRSGANGTYGTDCGAGAPFVNGTNQDHSDADPEMEIAQQASISVDDLHLGKATDGSILLTWTEPAHYTAINVTRYHVYRLDPATLFWTQIAEATKQTNSYSDPILRNGKDWQYKVTAVIK